MGKKLERVDEYIANAAPFAQPILTHIRELIHLACPDVEEAWKWSFPNFIYKGAVMCNIAGFKEHCSFGFWKASIMADPDNILSTDNRAGMGHMGKLTSLSDLPSDEIMIKYIQEAMKLTDEGKKVAPRAKATEAQKKEMVIPDYLIAELNKSPNAEEVFTAFSYSHKKEYVEWLEEAKTEATRNKRLAQAIEWISEGKGRNWKYANC